MHSINFKINPSILAKAFQNRLEDHLFTDLLIRTADGRELAAHRLIFAAASPALKEAILELDLEPTVTLILPDFKHEDIQSILPFLYGGYIKEKASQPVPCADLLKCLQIGLWHKLQSSNDESDLETMYMGQDYDNELYLEEEEEEEEELIKSELSNEISEGVKSFKESMPKSVGFHFDPCVITSPITCTKLEDIELEGKD